MDRLPKHITQKLNKQVDNKLLRQLYNPEIEQVDFCSNDYLGLALDSLSYENIKGSSGSRLISGNTILHSSVEKDAETFFGSPALLFNSGYQANLGVLQCIPQRGDLILYDENVHASMREGLRLSLAKSISFAHNSCEHLQGLLEKNKGEFENIYVLCEGLYSMQGDICPIEEFLAICERFSAYCIIDEAHSAGVFGAEGKGLTYPHLHSPALLLRIIPLGKAFNASGAFVLGNKELKSYLINFSRAFIYSTALSTVNCWHIAQNLSRVKSKKYNRELLWELVQHWNSLIIKGKSSNNSPIQFLYLNREKHPEAAEIFKRLKMDLRSIRYPTVSEKEEGFRVVLHSYNSKKEIDDLLKSFSRI